VDVTPGDGGGVTVNGDLAGSYPEIFSLKEDTYDVSIEAIPAPGYYFVGWNGESTLPGDDNPLELHRARNLELVAVFAPEGEVVEYASRDGALQVTIPYGISALDKEGACVTNVGFAIVDDPPQAANAEIVGHAYNIEPDGATFSPSVRMTWRYDPTDIPDEIAPEQLSIAYYEKRHDTWVALQSQVDLSSYTVSAWINHFSTFAILAPTQGALPELTPCLGQLNIRAGECTSGQLVKSITVSPDTEVYVDVRVRNIWETDCSYVVTLEIDGAVEKQEEVNLAAGHFTTVTFATSRSEVGSYSVTVSSLDDEANLIVTDGSPSPEPEATVSPNEPSSLIPATLGPNPKALILISLGVFCTVFALNRIRRNRDWY
jgi:hypothetical protein